MSRSGRDRGRTAIPKHWRYLLAERDGTDCAICKKPIGDIERANCDHIVPRAHGGKDKLENLQLTHYQCNKNRGAKVDREARIAQREGAGW